MTHKSGSDRKIDRWQQTIVPPAKRPEPWSIRSGGSWDMYEVAPIPDSMLAELMQRHHTAGAPWNCRSLPLSTNDREYMYLLYYSMIGLVARMREAEKRAAELEPDALRWRALVDCSRVRVIGYARGGPHGGEGAIRHIGFEFTIDEPDFDGREAEKSEGVRTLIEFVDAAAQAHG